MPWKKLSRNPAAGSGKIAWPRVQKHVEVKQKFSAEDARRFAFKNPNINFFLICRQKAVQLGSKNYDHKAAVFFTLPDEIVRKLLDNHTFSDPAILHEDCDLYVKAGVSVAYYNSNDSRMNQTISIARDYVMKDGGAAIDVVIIFAANLIHDLVGRNSKRSADRLKLLDVEAKPNQTKPSHKLVCATDAIIKDLADAQKLQKKGITVLLSVLNDHESHSWSSFSDPEDAGNFAKQLKHIVENYNLDGIDIDDEWAEENTPKIPTSLAMVTAMMRFQMPDKIISKALWAKTRDIEYLNKKHCYHGKENKKHFLVDNLTYGWEMSYDIPDVFDIERLEAYCKEPDGMKKKSVCKGFEGGKPYKDADLHTYFDKLKKEGYGGFMVFSFEKESGQDLMKKLLKLWQDEA